MNETRTIVNAFIVLVLIILITAFALDMRIPYPPEVINAFHQPIVRICVYICVFFVAYYNPIIGLLLMICVITLHLDIINLVDGIQRKHNKNST